VSDMIERIARALCGLAGVPAADNDEPDTEPDWKWFIPAARTILETIREPDEVMKEIGGEFFEEGTDKQNEFAAAIVYGAMISAALEGGDPDHG
jgi:hypothetical protein